MSQTPLPSLSLSTKQATRNANPTRHSRTGSFLLRCSLLSLPPTATHRDVTRAKSRTQKFIDFAELWSKQVEYDELSRDFVIFTQIDSNASFSLVISIINSRHLYGKPPGPLRVSGPKNPIFCSEWAFLRREKDDNMRSYICGHMHIFLSNQRFFVKKFSKNFMASPSSESADFGKPEPLWSRGFCAQMLTALLLKSFSSFY